MLETAFEPSMLMTILAENGVKWRSGGEITNKHDSTWHTYKEETCYWIEDGSIFYGSKRYAEEQSGKDPEIIKCTFYGADAGTNALKDVDISEEEFISLLNAGCEV